MKKLILASVLFMGSSAFADTTIFKCVVPNSTSASLQIDLADDQSADFVMVSLSEKSGGSTFFSQEDKGTVDAQLKNGFFQILALTEKSGQEDGVIVNTGILSLSKEADGSFSGLLAAKGNIYPLSCQH